MKTSYAVRALLLSGVSVIVLTAIDGPAIAADLPVKAPVAKAAAAPPPAPAIVTWYLEGGAFWTGGKGPFALFAEEEGFGGGGDIADAFGIGNGVRLQKPRVGWWGGAAVDYQLAASPYHLSLAFRYGETQKRRHKQSFTSSSSSGSLSVENKEKHWVADFMVGRDMGIGAGQAQLKLGLRVANLESKTNLAGRFACSSCSGSSSSSTGDFSATKTSQKSKFLGFGPRVAIDGSHPLGGAWSFDYGLGAAALFGQRKFDAKVTGVDDEDGSCCNPFSFTARERKNGAVFNADAMAALAVALNPNMKVSAGYKFDGYWKALIQQDENLNQERMNRFFHMPFLRLTGRF